MELKIKNFLIKHDKKTLFLSYTAIFSIIFFVLLKVFIDNGKSLIWTQDGLSEQLPKIKYLISYIRSLVRGLLGNGMPESFDFSLGLGGNVLTYTGVWFLDPFFLFLTFVPGRYFELGYEILIIIKCYVVGISFLLFCIYKKQHGVSPLIGSLIYTFSGFALEVFPKHPVFLTPMILLPLLFLSFERLVKESKGCLFSMLVAISAISSVYFLYMNTIIGIIYYLLSVVTLKEWRKNFFGILIYYFIGIGISAIIMLPIVSSILDSGRTAAATIGTPNLLSYGKNRISNLYN